MKIFQIYVLVVPILLILQNCAEKTPGVSGEIKDDKTEVDPKSENEHKWYYSLEEALQAPDSVFYFSLDEGRDELPLEILEFKNLTRLDISMDKFEYLPEEIGELHKLELLWATHGFLKELPTSIGNLKNLSRLILIDNDLSTLPNSIGNLESLEELNLNGNPIRELPPEIFRLKHLKTLVLRTNGEKSLISEEDQQKIKEGLPGCLIIFE